MWSVNKGMDGNVKLVAKKSLDLASIMPAVWVFVCVCVCVCVCVYDLANKMPAGHGALKLLVHEALSY